MQFGSLQEVIDQYVHDSQVVITDLGVLKPAAATEELTLFGRYENVSVDKIRAATGWSLAVANHLDVIPAPTADDLDILRDLHKRMEIAHARDVLRFSKTPRASLDQARSMA